MRDQRVGGVEDVAERAVVALELDHLAHAVLAFEQGHVADLRAAKGIDALVVVADREHALRPLRSARPPRRRKHLQPAVLQAIGVLEFVDQHVREAPLVVLAQRVVVAQQLVAAQHQLGEVDHALALALVFVGLVDLDHLARLRVVRLDVARALALFLVAGDEPAHLLGHETLFVEVHRLDHALDRRHLIGAVEDLERLRQRRQLPVRTQEAVAQTVEGADPHAAHVDRQHRGQPRQHLLGRLVGEGHRQHATRRHLTGGQQPGDARGQHARLARAGAGQDQRRLRGQRYCGQLLGIEVCQQRRSRSVGVDRTVCLQNRPHAWTDSRSRARHGGRRRVSAADDATLDAASPCPRANAAVLERFIERRVRGLLDRRPRRRSPTPTNGCSTGSCPPRAAMRHRCRRRHRRRPCSARDARWQPRRRPAIAPACIARRHAHDSRCSCAWQSGPAWSGYLRRAGRWLAAARRPERLRGSRWSNGSTRAPMARRAARSGAHGGRAVRAHPNCAAASRGNACRRCAGPRRPSRRGCARARGSSSATGASSRWPANAATHAERARRPPCGRGVLIHRVPAWRWRCKAAARTARSPGACSMRCSSTPPNPIVAISGTSAGAMNAVLLAHGLLEGRPRWRTRHAGRLSGRRWAAPCRGTR